LVGLAAALATLTVAGPASAATSISLYSDADDYIGGGRQRVFEAPDVGASMDGDTLQAWGGAFSFRFAAPPGERLEPRNYIGAQRPVIS